MQQKFSRVTISSSAVLLVHRLILVIRIALFIPLRITTPLSWQLKNRKKFEDKNLSDPASCSFKMSGLQADVTFHISSEGELEQVRPLIDYYLQKGNRLEIIYSSPSVEHRCQQIYSTHLAQIRLLRLPLLSYFPVSWWGGQSLADWISSNKLIMCRYDFYSELLLFMQRSTITTILVSATLKGKIHKLQKREYWWWRVYWRGIYSQFSRIIVATPQDEEYFYQLGITTHPLQNFDFRIIQVASRIMNSASTIKKTPMQSLIEYLEQSIPHEQRVLVGSAWPIEMDILASRPLVEQIIAGNLQLTIAPHNLSSESITTIINSIRTYLGPENPIYIFTPQMSEQEQHSVIQQLQDRPGPVITTVPAILCELYIYYGHVLVGGGHGRSIHSLLEPYLAGANLFCGPKTFRSTEYDIVKKHSSPFITVVDSLPDFYHLLKPILIRNSDRAFRQELICQHQEKFPLIAAEFLGE
ncbi:MAG: hypothetical protein HN353_13870 [Bdellovibrionales bacterium]|jgi:3-deoxy-D-manno-octulosonic-acid transferase|nr:hypothetical protein [Bdellovibrionales bacterium]MBT3526942.1 hypothetical protein [Bdellovibrionales bacterium]MBT7669694.1 hypothetical protein [Bdellovibrionales bacterium]MBT7767476.1 hypothetical protein [Bdellovibrionales bacterium]